MNFTLKRSRFTISISHSVSSVLRRPQVEPLSVIEKSQCQLLANHIACLKRPTAAYMHKPADISARTDQQQALLEAQL